MTVRPRLKITILSIFTAALITICGCSDVGDPLPAECSLSSANLDFGETTSGGTVDRSIDIINSGFEPLRGTASVSGAGFAIISGGGSYDLQSGESITTVVRFEPPSVGSYSGAFDGGADCAPVPLSGTAVDPIPNAQCDISPDSLNFAAIEVGMSASLSFRVLNSGVVDFAGTVVSPCGDYTVVSGGGAFTLMPGDSLVVTVAFNPSTVGQSECLISTGVNCPDVTCTGEGLQGTVEDVSYATQIQPIFDGNCAVPGCHVAPAPTGSLNLTSGVSYGNLVGVESDGYDPALRVVPDDPDASVLYNKVAGTGVFGATMPLGGPSLSDPEIALIRTWILEGADNTP